MSDPKGESRTLRHVIEGVVVLVAFASLAMVWNDHEGGVVGDLFDKAAALTHQDHEERLDKMETPERIVLLAQAADAILEVEEAARLAQENASAISNLVIEQQHTTDAVGELKDGQAEILEILRTPAPPRPSE